jgi:hypothetical protein
MRGMVHVVTTGHCSLWLDVCQQEQLEIVRNQWDLSQGESLNVHCCQTDIDDHVWHGVCVFSPVG